MRSALWTAIALIASAPACYAATPGGDGLRPWPQWQGRLSRSTSGPALGGRAAGGFRATSGLIVGARSSSALSGNTGNLAGRAFNFDHRHAAWVSPLAQVDLQPSTEVAAVPYVGVGYTGLANKGSWGFSADVGLVALSPRSAVKLGRLLGGAQSLDEVLRDMRVSPLVQLGVSYSF